ncbi:MAG: hypothetical protein HKO92_11195 [Flavobacteriaceae bacterium]|nr:hypothetical protein [Flavobacteriaceae bacterium]
MKTIYKILSLVLLLTVTVSCDREKVDTVDLLDRDNTIFFTSNSGIILVEEGAQNIFEIVVGTTAIASSDVNYTVDLDPASTAAEGVDYTFLNMSTTVSKGSLVSTVRLQADFDNASVDGKTVILNLNSSDAIVSSQNQFTLELIKLCPIEADFTGTYTLSTLTPGIFGVSTFLDGSVNISVGDTETDRVLTAFPYPAFGAFPAMDFTFSLICNNVIVPSGQATGVGCGGVTTFLGPSDTSGTYNASDDSTFNVIFVDDENGSSCGTEIPAEIQLTKN